MKKILQPKDWRAPKGYSNGISATGEQIFIGGQIGWNGQCEFQSDDFIDQCQQALQNIVDILAEADAGPEHMTRMTWYLVDKKEYKNRLKELGQVYRKVIGSHYPAMTAIQVTDLVEDRAKIEIEVTAVKPN